MNILLQPYGNTGTWSCSWRIFYCSSEKWELLWQAFGENIIHDHRRAMSDDYIIHLPCRCAHKVDTHHLQCRLHYPFSSAGGSERDFLFNSATAKAWLQFSEKGGHSYTFILFCSVVHISDTMVRQWPRFKELSAFQPLMLTVKHFTGSRFWH